MSSSPVSYFATFVASLRSVGTAVTLAMVGLYLHRRGFVSGEGKRTLAKISEQVTFPLFLFTKIIYCNQDWSDKPCPDVTKSLSDVWILTIWPAYVVGVGLLVGYAAAKIARTPKSQVCSVLASCGFGNSTGLPITLLTVVHANFPQTSDLGHIDPTLFLSVYLLLYPCLQWGVGGMLLAPEKEKDSIRPDNALPVASDEGTADQNSNQSTWLLSPSQTISASYTQNVLNNKTQEEWYKPLRRAIGETDASLYISEADLVGLAVKAENTVPHVPPPVLFSDSNSNNDGSQGYGGFTSYNGNGPQSPKIEEGKRARSSASVDVPRPPDETTALVTFQSYGSSEGGSEYEGESFWQTTEKILLRCFQPPVIGAIAGILIAATPLRGIFVDVVNRASEAPLQWFFDGLYATGQAAVPINMMILGCNLSASYNSHKKGYDSVRRSSEISLPSSNLLSLRTMIAIFVGKMVVMPVIGIISVILLKTYFLNIPDEIDGAFYLVMMIVFITPTANNVMVMVELSGSNTKEGIAQVIALQYALAPVILSATMSVTIGIADSWS